MHRAGGIFVLPPADHLVVTIRATNQIQTQTTQLVQSHISDLDRKPAILDAVLCAIKNQFSLVCNLQVSI